MSKSAAVLPQVWKIHFYSTRPWSTCASE